MEEQFLMIGKTLGHYEITSRLGKGGMVLLPILEQAPR